MTLIYLSPIFIIFEMLQLVVAERYIGIKQIKTGKHPLESGTQGPEWLAALWIIGLFAYWVYILALVFNPLTSMQGIIMAFISLVGVALRRTMGIRWALVIMTIEGAVRMGLLANLLISLIFYDNMDAYWSF